MAAIAAVAAVAADIATGSADEPPKKKKGVFKAIKVELAAAKQKYGSDLKLFWKKPGPPWPARATRTVPRPSSAQAYDVDELRVTLWFLSPSIRELPVKVEVLPGKALPKRIADKIAAAVESKWKKKLQSELDLPDHLSTGSWYVEYIFEWVEKKYPALLQLEPKMIESYLGFDEHGMTSRRYTLVDSTADSGVQIKQAVNINTTSELTEEEIAKREEIARKKALEKQRERDRVREAKRVEDIRKKEEAIRLRELGVETGGFRPLSKKEMAEKHKSKQGVRTAKTGSRRTKYAGPGSAIEKAASKAKNGGKKKKKKAK